MRTIKTFRFITISSLLLFVFIFEAKTQPMRDLQPLKLQDFECMKSLECAQNSQNLHNKGWAFVFTEPPAPYTREFTASMKSEDVNLNAKYNQRGDLIRARYKRNNAALPKCLMIHLTEDSDEDWQIKESELVMKNFDPASVRYRVKLQNQTTEILEEFDYDEIRNLHENYEGSEKLCLLK